jgi:hypothetical protein
VKLFDRSLDVVSAVRSSHLSRLTKRVCLRSRLLIIRRSRQGNTFSERLIRSLPDAEAPCGDRETDPPIISRKCSSAAERYEWIKDLLRQERGTASGRSVVEAFDKGSDTSKPEEFEFVCKMEGT